MENYYEYINEESIEKNLICNLCHKPFIQPVITPCVKTFCRQCVEQAPDYSKQELLSLTDPSVLIALDQIQVKCKLCDEINLERGHFQNHIIKLCPKAIVTCPASENNCHWIGLREEVPIHLSLCSYESLGTNSPSKY